MEGPLSLTVEWRIATKTHREGAYRVTRPDTDNLQKLLKDCMTAAGFWQDVTKRWIRQKPGIHIFCYFFSMPSEDILSQRSERRICSAARSFAGTVES